MTVEHPKLFKRTSTGAVQTWWIEQDLSQYRVHTGQIDGKITTSLYKQALGKNQGKKNETSDEEQALLEIEAEYKKKRAQGRYHDSQDDIDIEVFTVPMTAKNHKDRWKVGKMFDGDENYYSQRKLDGIRCVIRADGMWTRKGKPIVAMPHVWACVQPIFDVYPDIILDGELYNHELRHRLNRISGLCRKQILTDAELEETSEVEFHMYDVTGLAEFNDGEPGNETPNLDGDTRQSIRVRMVDWVYQEFEMYYGAGLDDTDDNEELSFFRDNVLMVETVEVKDQDHLDDLNARYLEEEYEGQMIRFASGVYDNKRSANLLKRKEFTDAEFTIVGFTEGVGNRAGMAGTVDYVTEDGKSFSSGIAGGVDFYKELWENQDKYIGGDGTVRYFKYTEYGIPYLPVTHVVYEGKRDV